MSATEVPWPGSRGASTVRPAAATADSDARIENGLPVKPCKTRAPWSPPEAENGSAPGMTGALMSKDYGACSYLVPYVMSYLWYTGTSATRHPEPTGG